VESTSQAATKVTPKKKAASPNFPAFNYNHFIDLVYLWPTYRPKKCAPAKKPAP
jgi:hypothetical protein